MSFISRAVAITNAMLNKNGTNFPAVRSLAGPVLIVETFAPLLERIAVALESQAGIRPVTVTSEVSVSAQPGEWAERVAEAQARTQRAIQASNELHVKHKEALETITRLQERLRMVGLPV